MSGKLIMVDLDGTLVDTSRVNYFAYKQAMKQYGYELDFDYFMKNCYGKHYLDFLPDITTKEKTILNKIHDAKKNNYSAYIEKAILNKVMLDILQLAKLEYKIALVTTASRQNSFEILEHFQLSDFFDLVITREDVSHSKPDPEGYKKALQYFQVETSNAIIFEDSDSGLEAARRTGCSYFRTYIGKNNREET